MIVRLPLFTVDAQPPHDTTYPAGYTREGTDTTVGAVTLARGDEVRHHGH